MNPHEIMLLAARWLEAEDERKLRKKERNMSYAIAVCTGWEIDHDRSTRTELFWTHPLGDESQSNDMHDAVHKRYLKSARKVNGLRAALRAKLKPYMKAPVPDAELKALYESTVFKDEGCSGE